MTDPITLLREADPVERLDVDLDAPPPIAVLERITATPPRRTPRRALSRLAIAAVGACAAAAAVLALLSGGAEFDPAARAYAQTAPGPQILHVIVNTSMVMTGSHPIRQQDRDEMWQYGDKSHRVTATSQQDDSNGTPPHETIEYVKVGDVLRARMQDGEIQTTRTSDSDEARRALQTESDFVAAFRRRYEKHALRDAGETTFAGRRARAYEVTDAADSSPGELRPPATKETYYLEAKTGDPLGSIRTMALYDFTVGRDHKPVQTNVKTGDIRTTEVVERLERLPLTPANLAKLTAPWAKPGSTDSRGASPPWPFARNDRPRTC
jgi:hypothetical protein